MQKHSAKKDFWRSINSSLSFCRTVPLATWSRATGILRQYWMNAGRLTPAHSQKLSPAAAAQHFLSSYCAPSKDFSLHTSFTTCYRDFTKPVHTLYTKKRRERTGLGKKACLPGGAL